MWGPAQRYRNIRGPRRPSPSDPHRLAGARAFRLRGGRGARAHHGGHAADGAADGRGGSRSSSRLRCASWTCSPVCGCSQRARASSTQALPPRRLGPRPLRPAPRRAARAPEPRDVSGEPHRPDRGLDDHARQRLLVPVRGEGGAVEQVAILAPDRVAVELIGGEPIYTLTGPRSHHARRRPGAPLQGRPDGRHHRPRRGRRGDLERAVRQPGRGSGHIERGRRARRGRRPENLRAGFTARPRGRGVLAGWRCLPATCAPPPYRSRPATPSSWRSASSPRRPSPY